MMPLELQICLDLHAVLGFSCCDSCHDDVELGYDLVEVEWRGKTWRVCCAGADAIREAIALEEGNSKPLAPIRDPVV